jgi:membrane protein DedA with SNARE-associated domain
MEEFFVTFCEHLRVHPLQQALVITLGTCYLEDPARCAVVVMLASGHITNWWLTFGSMTLGGMIGDIALYVFGRFGMGFLIRRNWVDPERVHEMKQRFGGHLAWSSFVARFLPGMRTIVYVSAGSMRFHFGWFLLVLFVAAAIQAYLYLLAADFISEHVLPYLKSKVTQGILFALLIGSVIFLNRAFSKRANSKIRSKV